MAREQKDSFDMGEYWQWWADRARVLRAGLWNDDPKTVAVAYRSVAERFGTQVANDFLFHQMTKEIGAGRFHFINEKGQRSRLL